METLLSFKSSSHPLLLQSSKNKGFYPFTSSPSSSSLIPTIRKPEFVSFPHKRNYNSLKAGIGSVSCKASASDQSSLDPKPEDNNGGSTKIPPPQEPQPKMVRVEFQLIKECLFREEFLIIGNHPILGSWNLLSALPLKWSDGHIWKAEVDMPIKKTFQFMFILRDRTGDFSGQPGPHKVFQTGETNSKMIVLESWDFEGLQRTSEEEPNTSENVIAQSKTVKVKFQLRNQCLVGQEYFVIGDDPILGGWDPSGAVPLKWSEGYTGHEWTSAALDMPIGKEVQFRFIRKDATTGEVISWQARPNSSFTPWEIDADHNFMVDNVSTHVVNTKDYEAEESKQVPRRPSPPDPFKDEKYDPTSFFNELFKKDKK